MLMIYILATPTSKPNTAYSLVFTAGNADTFSRVLLTLKILRNHYNTSLPAEIFSFPGEMPPPDLLDEFVKYNATLRVVCRLSPNLSNIQRWLSFYLF